MTKKKHKLKQIVVEGTEQTVGTGQVVSKAKGKWRVTDHGTLEWLPFHSPFTWEDVTFEY